MTRLFWLAGLLVGALANKHSSESDGATIIQASSGSSGSETVTITIVGVNNGGNSQTQYQNGGSADQAVTHEVMVGGSAGLVYTPETISANVGDVVKFQFLSQNHTVTQSSFTAPCVRTSDGVDSGFMANPNNTVSPAPYMLFEVQTTKPIWMYCKQKGHCGKGMVFSINPTADKSQATFKAAAISQNGTASASSTTSSTTGSNSTSSGSSSASGAVSSVVAGTGSNASGQCSCACLCGSAAFPQAAIQGVGMSGGLSGSISAASVGTMGKKRSVNLIS